MYGIYVNLIMVITVKHGPPLMLSCSVQMFSASLKLNSKSYSRVLNRTFLLMEEFIL